MTCPPVVPELYFIDSVAYAADLVDYFGFFFF